MLPGQIIAEVKLVAQSWDFKGTRSDPPDPTLCSAAGGSRLHGDTRLPRECLTSQAEIGIFGGIAQRAGAQFVGYSKLPNLLFMKINGIVKNGTQSTVFNDTI